MLPPIVERELRVALLHRRARRQWLGTMWIAGGITLLFLGFSSASITDGSTLFRWLFGLACLAIIANSFTLTADLFSEERRNGTLGLLVLTGLTPLEIFMNKLMGAMVLTSYGLLGALPFFAVPFLAGGVPAEQFFCALLFLANALLFCVAIGLLASVLHREGGLAQVTAVALSAGLCLGGIFCFRTFEAISGGASEHWLAASPAYGAALLMFGNFTSPAARIFWQGSAITLSYSVIALLVAALILQRTWRDGPAVVLPRRWFGFNRKSPGSDARWRRVQGKNPFCWLVARKRGPTVVAYALLLFIAFLWLAIWTIGGPHHRNSATAIAVSALLHAGLNWILAYAGAKHLSEERQNGGFEILLTTPLSTRVIVEGLLAGLLTRFKTVGVFVLLLDVTLMSSGFFAQDWNAPAAFTFWITMLPVFWFWINVHLATVFKAMWIGTWTGRPGYAAIKSMRGYLWVLVWWCIPALLGVEDYAPSMCFGLFFVPFLAFSDLGDRNLLREKLIGELHAIACAQIPAKGDPKFRRWNPKLIYPPGTWGNFYWEKPINS